MKHKSTTIILSLILALLPFLAACSLRSTDPPSAEPFRITVNTVKILDGNEAADQIVKTGSGNTRKRIYISFSIDNQTDNEYKNVTYRFSFNKDLEPFIGSGLLGYESEPMDVVPASRAQQSTAEPIVSGFEGEYEMLLTDDDVLLDYFALRPDQLKDHLKSLTFELSWDGGKQASTIPVSLDQ